MATNYWRRGDVDAVVQATSAKGGPLERAADATEQIAANSRSQVAIALDARDGDPGSWSAGPTDGIAPEQVVRSLTRWQGSDTTSLVRALRASFERTPVQGRSVLRYRGAGRVWSGGVGSSSSVGPGARTLRRITPGLQDVLDLLDRLEPVDPTADAVAARSAAAAIRDRLDSYTEELGRGFDSRPARLRAIRQSLRGSNPAKVGGSLRRLRQDLKVPRSPATPEEEGLSDDYLVLVDYVYALDGSVAPAAGQPATGPAEWRDDVEDDLATVHDLVAELRTRLRVEGVSLAQLESRVFTVNKERQSVADVIGWTEELVASTAPTLLGSVARREARDAIDAELTELRQWVAQMRTLALFSPPLLQTAVTELQRGLRRLTNALRRV